METGADTEHRVFICNHTSRGICITIIIMTWHVTISCHLFDGLHKPLFPLGLHDRTRHILCAKWPYRLTRFIIALCSVDSRTVIFCTCFRFSQISRSAATAPQSSSAPGATSPNTKLLIRPSFATVCITANGLWIFRCHCHYMARRLVCSLIRRCHPIDMDHQPVSMAKNVSDVWVLERNPLAWYWRANLDSRVVSIRIWWSKRFSDMLYLVKSPTILSTRCRRAERYSSRSLPALLRTMETTPPSLCSCPRELLWRG